MKKRRILAILILSAVPMIATSQEGKMDGALLLDDFSGQQSAIGSRWEGFTDQVMGGVSEMDSRIVREGDSNVLHLSGDVSLENNGGFIQVRLRLDPDERSFDASEYTGVGLRVRGSDRGYYVHLRTTRTVFPWSYYAQEFKVGGEWSTVHLPFSDFQAEYMRSNQLNTKKLTSVAIVAAKREFSADLYVDSVFLYK
jgi:hypothetical protein